jgi:hypothetical protein
MHLFPCRRLRSLLRLLVIGPLLIGCGHAPAAASERKPRIRTITAFVRIDSSQYRQQIEEGVAVLRQAKTAFERGGYLRPHMEHIRHTGGVCPRLSSPVDFDPVPIL